MKHLKRIYVMMFFLVNTIYFAQVPNGDFEEWQGIYAKNWTAWMQGLTPPSNDNRTELPSTDAYSGALAMMCHNRYFPISAGFPAIYTVVPGSIEQTNISISEKPICMTGAFKIIGNVKDTLFVELTLKKNGSIIGTAQYTATGEVNSYSVFCVSPVFISSDIPTSYDLRIGFNQLRWHGNSSSNTYLLIDGVELLRPAALPEINKIEHFKIVSDLSSDAFVVSAKDGNSDKVSVRLLSLEGKELLSQTHVALPYKFSTASLTTGMYVLQVISENTAVATFKIMKPN